MTMSGCQNDRAAASSTSRTQIAKRSSHSRTSAAVAESASGRGRFILYLVICWLNLIDGEYSSILRLTFDSRAVARFAGALPHDERVSSHSMIGRTLTHTACRLCEQISTCLLRARP